MHRKYRAKNSSGLILARLVSGLCLLGILLAATVLSAPAHAATAQARSLTQAQDTLIDANFYLPTGTLRPIFQDRVTQQVPTVVNNAINGILAKLPADSRGWAGQLARTLIKPSATLNGLTPQAGGLAASLSVNLYPGDPKPLNIKMLVTFSVKDAATIQISAKPLPGSPALVNGPLATLQMPIGQLNSIHTTPSCGVAALSVGLRFPIALNSTPQATATPQGLQSHVTSKSQSALSYAMPTATGNPAYVEIPAPSLAALGASFGTLQLSNSMSAQNIQVAVAGGQLVVTSDIYLGSFQLGTATTLMNPVVANGNLAIQVQRTTLNVLIFKFQYNTYNKQIEQMLNDKLSTALAGKFTVSSAVIGANSDIPCAAADSLILTGTTNAI